MTTDPRQHSRIIFAHSLALILKSDGAAAYFNRSTTTGGHHDN